MEVALSYYNDCFLDEPVIHSSLLNDIGVDLDKEVADTENLRVAAAHLIVPNVQLENE